MYTYVCSWWFNHVESAHFPSLPSILLCFFNALHKVVSWLLTLKHRLQSITPSTKHLSSWWKAKAEHVRLQPLTSTAFMSTNAGLLATCILRGPCLALEKVKLYQIKPTPKSCFVSKENHYNQIVYSADSSPPPWPNGENESDQWHASFTWG